MFSFKKISSPALTALLVALLLPAGSFAEEADAKAEAKPAVKAEAKPKASAKPVAKTAAKPAAKSAKPAAKAAAKTKPAAKAAAKPAVKAAPKTAVAPAAAEPAKEQAKEAVKEPAKASVAEAAKVAPDQPMVKVNGTPITRGELDRALKVMLAQSQVQQPLPAETLKQAEAAALEQLTSAELLYQEAAKLTVENLDSKIAEKLAQNRSKFNTETEFADALKEIDMTVKDVEDYTRKDLIINNFIETQFTAKTAATEAEARKFYEDNMDQYFKKPESARASHILIGVDEKASAEERKKGKEKAEALLKRIKAGEDFAALAKSDSACPSSAQGGDLGPFGKGQMVEAFEDAAFALKPGEVSGVVESQYGYHIIKLTEKQESTVDKFETVKDKISEFLKKQKVQQELSGYIEELKKGAKIEKM